MNKPMMNRRQLSLGLVASAVWLRDATAAEPREGQQYTRLSSPVPVAVPGKIEVLEFFGYWCPHCYQLESGLQAWAAKLPASVVFRRSPVGWQASHVPFQKLFFALEAMGASPALHGKVFDALHRDRLRLDNDAGLGVFAQANGIDKGRLLDLMNGFSVNARVKVANQLYQSYRLDGVPALAVNGQYLTSPMQAGGDAQVLQVVDALIQKARSKG
jgi:thiol:disulfide interchange protein DsbA